MVMVMIAVTVAIVVMVATTVVITSILTLVAIMIMLSIDDAGRKGRHTYQHHKTSSKFLKAIHLPSPDFLK